jgi:hypothetical protein
MTRYRAVTRTGKYGSIKQHYDIDFIFYAQFTISYKGEHHCFSTTTRTLDFAEQWIETEREAKKIELGYKKRSYKKKTTSNYKKPHDLL